MSNALLRPELCMDAAERRYRHNVPTKIRLRNGQGFGGSPRRRGCNTLQSCILYILYMCAFVICNSRARDLDPKNQKLFLHRYYTYINNYVYILLYIYGTLYFYIRTRHHVTVHEVPLV